MLQSYNFLHNARPSLGAIAAPPDFHFGVGHFPAAPRHPTRTPTHKRSTNEKNGALSRQMCPLSEKTPQLFSPLAPPLFSPSAIPLARVGARARTRTQRVFDFCLHRTAIHAQPTENKRIVGEAFTRIVLFDNQLWINGEEVKAKIEKTADARVRARIIYIKHILFLHRRRLGMLGKGA